MTDDELLSLPKITAKDASDYLGIPQQGCRELARAGKIGVPREGTNKVLFQARKMVAYKRGYMPDEEQIELLAQKIVSMLMELAKE